MIDMTGNRSREEKQCTVEETGCPASVNIRPNISVKENTCVELLRNLQLLYPTYNFSFMPVIIGVLGYMTQLGF